jgi:hypothetical protein
MTKSIIVVEIPHQRPATSWVANGKDAIVDHARSLGIDNSAYSLLKLEDLIRQYGDESDIPVEALEIVKRDGTVFEVMGAINDGFEENPYIEAKDAPTEFEWACAEIFHDLSHGQIIENDADLDWFKQNVTHQREKAIIAVDASRKEIDDWEQS